MFALVDCNNFYVSCERLFAPALRNRPVVVLSNNDGCIVARSQEVKDLGVAMGAPLFAVRDLLRRHKVAIFSSNYALYGDISQRVMDTLRQQASAVEVYSIDEAFLHLPVLSAAQHLAWARAVRATVDQHTGIPVSIGIGPTKTLSKVASRLAKRGGGVHVLCAPSEIEAALDGLDVADVWGIGARHAERLRAVGVHTAAQFTRLPGDWVRQQMTVVGLRIQRELLGEPCLPLELAPRPRQSMVHSRSFGRTVRRRDELAQVLASYTARLGEKLRRHGLVANHLGIFLVAPQRLSRPPHALEGELPCPTAHTPTLIQTAWNLLDRIDADGEWKKAGVMALELHGAQRSQLSMFARPADPRVMAALDAVNARHGPGTLRLAAEGRPAPPWQMRQDQRSPRYTTHWSEIPHIHL